MLDSYSERGGARWGQSLVVSTGVSWPLAKLTLTEEYIELSALKIKKFHFERQTILEIRFVHQLWYTVAQIIHTKGEYPEYVAYGPQHPKSLRSKLERFGYASKF